MGLKYYLNLFKGEQNNKTVTRRYYINVFLILAFFALFFAYFFWQSKSVVLSCVLAVLAFVSVFLLRLLNHKFENLIDRLIKDEPLCADSGIDAAFCKYRQGFAAYRQTTKRQNRILFPINILAVVLFIGIVPATMILDLTGKTELSGKLHIAINIIAIVYLACILISSIFLGRKGVWTQDCYLEIAQINKYKTENGSRKTKYKFSEDKKPIVQLEYMFVSDALRRQHIKLSKVILRGGCIFPALLGVAFGITASVAENFPGKKSLFDAIIIGLWIMLGLYVAVIVVISIIQSKTLKKQYKMLMENPDQNALCLSLHKLRTPFVRRWSILLLVCIFGNIISNLVLAGVVSHFAGGGYGWIFFLLFWVELIAMFVVYFKQFAKLRLKMMPIEDEIDRAKLVSDIDDNCVTSDPELNFN